MKKKSGKKSNTLGRVLFILAGALLIADSLFVMTRSSMNLGVMLPLVIGAPLLLIGLFLPGIKKLCKKSRVVRAAAFVLSLAYLLGGLVFTATTALVLINSSEPDDGADVLIVLGGGIRGTSPTLTLKYRLDSAAEYLERNPGTLAIVSGGQGADEQVTEASVMRQYLINCGIDPNRILSEEASSSTEENFRFSKAMIDGLSAEGRLPAEPAAVFTTTRFHVFRSELAAAREGLSAEGIPAKGVWYITPNDYLRECVAIVVYFVLGKI